MRTINLELSDEDYRRLRWVAEKWGVSVTKSLRMLIPSIQLEEPTVIKESDISQARFDDLVPVLALSEKDLRELRSCLNDLTEKGWGVTLAREIQRQLLDKEGKFLTANTCKRLARWLSPYRQTAREEYVKPRAKRISQLLFGHYINRAD